MMKTGDIVKWVKTTINGSRIKMHQYDGTLEAIDGDFGIVCKHNGRRERIALKHLRLEHEKGQLTEFFEEINRG